MARISGLSSTQRMRMLLRSGEWVITQPWLHRMRGLPGSSAAACEMVEFEGSGAQAERGAALADELIEQLVLIGLIPDIVVEIDDDVVDLPPAQERGIAGGRWPAAPIDALREELGIQLAAVLDELIHAHLAIGDAEEPIGGAGFER